jgi:serine/threonine protein kinase/TolB-like protein/Tfp pilus assembly protein PilF
MAPAMTPDRWQSVKAVAAGALELPAERRAAFIADSCKSDADLSAEVVSLLQAAAAAAALYETPALAVRGATILLEGFGRVPSTLVGSRIGPYRVVSELGRGGMGAAYLAERADDAYRRQVAIKVIKRGMDSDAIVRRFLHERQILANLNHPNIAMLLDGGTTDDGLPYFVMEYVEGQPIDRFCTTHRLSTNQRLTLLRAVCDAVHHAHERRVIHRDLKPGNILVSEDGIPKLLDFGIAKVLDADLGNLTSDGTLLVRAMTPQYASPEQVRGGTITAASDVYSLGVLLYELLARRPPYQLTGQTRLEAEALICDEMPLEPSRAVDREASERSGESAGDLRRQLSGNLDAIVLTALHKDPACRYASANALGEDIGRHLAGQPIAARPEWSRWRRSPWLALTAVVATAVLIGVAQSRGVPQGSGPITSVAILPLTGRGATPDLEYLSAGITDGLTNRLSRMSSLKVIARDSAVRFSGPTLDPRDVGRALGVQAIVTGHVLQRGSELVFNVSLLDARDNTLIWREQYARPVDEIQALHAELAQRIAERLRVQLAPGERARLAEVDRRDPDAYASYLRGRHFWNRRSTANLQRSVGYFRQAAAADPEFALAHAGLADALSLLTEYGGARAADTYREARGAAARALEIDETLAEAHTSMAYIKQYYEWDWPGAEAAFRRAIELNPRYPTAHQWYAEFLSAMGRPDEALAHIRIARELDPLSLIVNTVEALVLYMARRYDEAIQQSLNAIDLDPNFPEAYEYLKRAYDRKGSYAAAIAARRARRKALGFDTTETHALRTAAAATSADVYWRSRLAQEHAESKTEGVFPWELAEINAQVGDVPRALDWLERACNDHEFFAIYMRVAPNLDPLRREPRYAALVARGCGVPRATP